MKFSFTKFLKKLGPGLITGVSDDDPSGIATYSQAGARFGLAFLWTALFTFPLMYIIQEMCARIAIVSRSGLARVIKTYYSRSLTVLISLCVIPAIILNIAANFSAMGAVSHLLIPLIPSLIFIVFFTTIIMISLIYFHYATIATALKYLCLALICYFIVPFLVQEDWHAVGLSTFIPSIEWNHESLSMLVAILGTTISPYLFYWQTFMAIEENHQKKSLPYQEIKEMKGDVMLGMFLSNLGMYFIILTTGSVLFPAGIRDIQTVEQAAQALKPLAGELAYLLFSMGIIGVGMLSVPILAACNAYILAETFHWNHGLNKKPQEAPEFYLTILGSLILGLLINVFNIDPIKSLILTAIVYGVTAPILIGLILHICNNSKIMGNHTNSWVSNFLGVLAFLLMSLAAIAMVFF